MGSERRIIDMKKDMPEGMSFFLLVWRRDMHKSRGARDSVLKVAARTLDCGCDVADVEIVGGHGGGHVDQPNSRDGAGDRVLVVHGGGDGGGGVSIGVPDSEFVPA